MNFQNLGKIENYQFYLDVAFKRASNKAAEIILEGTRLQKSRKKEKVRVEAVHGSLTSKLMKILTVFPSLGELTEFYHELVKCTLDYAELKKSLGSLNWAVKTIDGLLRKYQRMIVKCEDLDKITLYRKQFYGRVSSVLKQINKDLAVIDNARRVMRNYPAIKTKYYSVAICGFPNVGKTTLLSKLTGSTPDIKSYAFTTKGINIGYYDKVQYLDTPGTLNRFDKMNNIEKIAHLAVKHVTDTIIYIFDLTEEYPLKDQVKLLLNLKKFKKPILIYLSKTDLVDEEKVLEFSSKYKAYTDVKELREKVLGFRK